MATSTLQDRDFIATVINQNLLEEAIDWIQSNLEPEDVFDESELRTWAENSGYEEAE